jgi:phosphohistidine swiveling domain-containing protein
MWEGRYSLTYCELKANAYSHKPFVIGGEYRNYLYVSRSGWLQAYAPIDEIGRLVEVRYAQLMDPLLARRVLEESVRICSEQASLTEDLRRLEPSKLTRSELAHWYERYIDLQKLNHVYFTVSQPEMLVGLERELELYAQTISQNQGELINCLSLLTTPAHESTLTEEEKAWKQIVLSAALRKDIVGAVKASPEDFEQNLIQTVPDLVQWIDRHVDQFGWLPTQELNPAWNRSHYVWLLQQELGTPIQDLETQYQQITDRLAVLLNKREALIGQVLPPPAIGYQATLLRELAALRWNLRLSRTRADFVARTLRQEIAQRANIDPYRLEYLLLSEIYDFLLYAVPISLERIEERLNCYAWRIEDGRSELFTGEKAVALAEMHASESCTEEQTSEIRGQTASRGRVRGPVRLLPTAGDHLIEALNNVKEGDILVTGQTRPQLMIACRKVKAIVTDEGGIASHAAVVSRELGIPCIVGTGNGTKVLRDGDIVEVDASSYQGAVRILSRQDGTLSIGKSDDVFIMALQDATEMGEASVGNKASTLGRLRVAGFRVPQGFVITTEALKQDLGTMRRLVMPLLQKMQTSLVAVRSSATCEDSPQFSFAGQFTTFLNVAHDDVLSFVQRCLESARAPNIITYCASNQIDPNSIEMAILIQEMIQSEVSGVCFSVDPISENPRKIRVSACYGLGELLVSGRVIPDEYLVSTENLTVVERTIGRQSIKLELRDGKNTTVALANELREIQKVTDKQIQEVARTTLTIADVLGYEVEVEWAIQHGIIYILQARPITTLGSKL